MADVTWHFPRDGCPRAIAIEALARALAQPAPKESIAFPEAARDLSKPSGGAIIRPVARRLARCRHTIADVPRFPLRVVGRVIRRLVCRLNGSFRGPDRSSCR